MDKCNTFNTRCHAERVSAFHQLGFFLEGFRDSLEVTKHYLFEFCISDFLHFILFQTLNGKHKTVYC